MGIKAVGYEALTAARMLATGNFRKCLKVFTDTGDSRHGTGKNVEHTVLIYRLFKIKDNVLSK